MLFLTEVGSAEVEVQNGHVGFFTSSASAVPTSDRGWGRLRGRSWFEPFEGCGCDAGHFSAERKLPCRQHHAHVSWRVSKDNDLSLAFSREMNETQDVHNVSMPNLGLAPKPLTFPERDQWLAGQAVSLGGEFRGRLIDLWIQTYCNNDSGSLRKYAEEELVFRCLRQPKGEYPTFAANWFQSKQGLSIQQANELVGILH